MSSQWFSARNLIGVFSAPAIILAVNFTICSCQDPRPKTISRDPLKDAKHGLDRSDSNWASWNVLLKPGLDAHARSAAILKIENYLNNQFLIKFPTNYRIRFEVFYCPCDSSLYNIGAKVINGSGDAVTTPPPPPPPGGSGDALFVSNNNRVIDTDTLSVRDSTNKLAVKPTEVDSTILAVIDTGLDPGYFTREARELIWSGEGANTIYNLVGPDIHSYFDDHQQRHGTIVTAVALNALMDQNSKFGSAVNRLPHVMVLKALDEHKQGSTFSVSCALSYAIQHHAAVINASLGYYEMQRNVDSVFRHYVQLCGQETNSLTVFTAAGNLGGVVPGNICNTPGLGNLLTVDRMFYPACFSSEFNNVFSVTTLTKPNASCFYQNYSVDYVSLGVIQTGTPTATTPSSACCYFWVPFAMANGTSYATPVASGTAMSYLLNGHTAGDFIQSLSTATSPPLVTKNGRYFNYSSH